MCDYSLPIINDNLLEVLKTGGDLNTVNTNDNILIRKKLVDGKVSYMSERERLICLLHNARYGAYNSTLEDAHTDGAIEEITDYLLENGVILPPVKIGQSIWTSKPFKDGLTREGYITVIEYDNDGFCGFWASFGEIPLSAEFSNEEIGETVFI